MRVILSEEEVARAIARAAVEKANGQGFLYLWGDHVEVEAHTCAIRAEIRDGRQSCVRLFVYEVRIPIPAGQVPF